MEKTLDLYTDYLISSFGQTSATSLSRLVDGDVSHDFISRLLSNNEFTAKTLWEHVKPLIRKYETENACLVVEKKYTKENEITCWHYDHSEGESVKGFNILNAFYHSQPLEMSQPVRLPISFEIIKKTIFCVIKTKKTTRISPITKNEMMCNMLTQAIHNQLIFKYVLADTWFSSTDNMRFIQRKEKFFIFDMKDNRMTALSEKEQNKQHKEHWTRID